MPHLRIIDLETTGLESNCEVIEAGFCDLDRDKGLIFPPRSTLYGVAKIPPDVRAVHHIWEEDVAGLPRFDAEQVLLDALDCEIVGFAAHMASFEAQWIGRVLEGVLPLICTYKASLRRRPEAPSHSNFGLFYWLLDRKLITPLPVRDMTQPSHRAGPDAYVTAHILKALFDAGVTGKDMVGWTREPALLPTCPLGKMRGKAWPDVNTGFLQWMLKQADMEADYKWNAERELSRRGEL